MMTETILCQELEAFARVTGLRLASADEMLCEACAPAPADRNQFHVSWLRDFLRRWDEAMARIQPGLGEDDGSSDDGRVSAGTATYSVTMDDGTVDAGWDLDDLSDFLEEAIDLDDRFEILALAVGASVTLPANVVVTRTA